MNLVDVADQAYIPAKAGEETILSFFGGLHLERWKMIIRLANQIAQNIRLRVYSYSELPAEVINALIQSGVDFRGEVKGNDLASAIQESTALLHVESDDAAVKSWTKYSLSSKLPEYFIARKLVVLYGPPDVASMELVHTKQLGVYLNPDDDGTVVLGKLLNTIQDKQQTELIINCAYVYALENFDRKTVAQRFFTQLCSICAK
jgi:hypothetical protein